MGKYCKEHGHAPPYLAKPGQEYTCLNCGDAAVIPGDIEYPHLPDVQGTSSDHMGDGKPETKPSNPKDAVGATKLPVSWVPTAVARYAAMAFAEGALKYGRYNWRVAGVRISIYLDAMHRHLMKFQDGEWADGDSLGLDENGNRQGTGVPHLASIIACAGIILDANECNKLTDDRPPINPAVDDMMTTRIAHIAYLKELFADYNPHQCVITDATDKEK